MSVHNYAFFIDRHLLTDVYVRVRCVYVKAMRVEVDFEGGQNAAGIFVHKSLSSSVGQSVAAFAQSVLSGQTKPGVWFPEEQAALSVGGG